MLRVLDLFSGIGGFSLGLERTGGFKTVAFCEIDPFCRKVLAKHWRDVPCHDDVETRLFEEGEADVITAGFPCQDISYAGAGAGLAGARSGLYRHVVRAIRLVRPRFAILENVAALLGRGLGTVLGDLAEIGADAEWHCIPASAVGAPHRRDRIWIVANTDGSERGPLSGACDRMVRALRVPQREEGPSGPSPGGEDGSNASPMFRASLFGGEPDGDTEGVEALADAGSARLERAGDVEGEAGDAPAGQSLFGCESLGRQWLVEPDVGRVAHGVPARVDRLRSLGNAVVPQIPELIGRAILSAPSPDSSEPREG